MKKILMATIFLSIALVLVGCSSKEYNQHLESGKTALNDKRFDDAITSFKAAYLIEATQEVLLLQQQALVGKRDALIAEGDELAKKGKFSEAIELYDQALKMDPKNEELQTTIKTAKGKIDDQEKLNTYAAWLKEMVSNGSKIHSAWSNISKDAAGGILDKSALQFELSELKEYNAKLKIEVDERVLEDEIPGKVHESLSNIFSNNDRILTDLIALSTNQASTISDILTKGTALNELHSNLISYQKAVQDYAKEKGLKYNK